MAIVFLMSLSLNINAQNGPGGGGMRDMPPSASFKPFDPEERIEDETTWMKKKLKLSNDQMVKVTRISEKYAYAQAELMPKPVERLNTGSRPDGGEFSRGGRTREDKEPVEARLKQLSIQKDAEMQIVLTEKQFKKYKKRREDLSKDMQNNSPAGGVRPTGGPPQGGRPNF